MCYRVLLFCAFLVGRVACEFVDNACINQHLRKIHLIDEDIVQSHNQVNRKCNKYISSLTVNFYKLWQYHYKHQTPKLNGDANIRCFIKESKLNFLQKFPISFYELAGKKYQLHDRYMLDLLLREKESTDKKIFQRNSLLFERLRREATNKCEIHGY